MTKDSPEMEIYSRLLSHLQESCKKKNPEVYEGFVSDITVLDSNNKDTLKSIENDLKTILPPMLLFSVNKDVNIRTAVIKSFVTFNKIVNKKPSIKSESWWKEMEFSIIAQDFSSHLIKLAETTTDVTWPHIWAFVISLIVHDEQVHGLAINSLLKVVEIAFKLSRKHESVLEKAYFCWNRLIDIFSVHPRIVTSQKLIELLVRPLSTNLSLKCPKLKLETWSNLVHKVGFACGNTKCKLVIEPFIDFAYLKENDSLCHLYPVDCISAFRDVVMEKKIFKYCVLKIMSALVSVFQSGPSEDLNEYLIEIWSAVIDNSKELEKSNQSDYVKEFVDKIPQVLQLDRPGLNSSLIQVTLKKKFFSTENMKMLILAQTPVMPVISSLMKHDEFESNFFPPLVDDLLEYFTEAQNKKSQSTVELEIWDLTCEVFILWLKSLPPPQESSVIDDELLCSLLLVPLLSKQWSVPVQKTWNSIIENTLISVPSNNYLSQFINRFYKELSEMHISAEFAVEFCTFLSNRDKSVFKLLMPTFSLISKSLPNKDPKPLMELLVLIENSIKFIPKQDLIKLLTELMGNSNSYGQPYDLRIKTKITKLQRKLFTLKDPNEGTKEQEVSQSAKNQSEKEQPQSSQKTRSPLMAHSNFLHRLAKAEEKKVKKRASMSSIFGDMHNNEDAELACTEVNNTSVKSTDSPDEQTQVTAKDDKTESVAKKEEGKEVEGKKAPVVNGRSSPVIPSVITVVTTPNRKRSLKVPEAAVSQEIKKPVVNKPTPPPPSFFEDDAQDYVIVPPKPKTTPLTEHQKEVMSKRRSDIPALYQDLSQDTQSMNSQSLKEIAMLKEIKMNDTAKSLDVIAGKEEKEETINVNPKVDEENKEKDESEGAAIIENGFNDSSEIINDTQTLYDSGVNLSLTPTKHSSIPPSQKNLLTKFNLLECEENGENKKVDEEDEVEKENKVVNIEEVSNQKSVVKRRSTRRSTNKYVTKKNDEIPRTRTKKESNASELTQSSESMPKGKTKRGSETNLKNVDDTKTKLSALEALRRDLEDDIDTQKEFSECNEKEAKNDISSKDLSIERQVGKKSTGINETSDQLSKLKVQVNGVIQNKSSNEGKLTTSSKLSEGKCKLESADFSIKISSGDSKEKNMLLDSTTKGQTATQEVLGTCLKVIKIPSETVATVEVSSNAEEISSNVVELKASYVSELKEKLLEKLTTPVKQTPTEPNVSSVPIDDNKPITDEKDTHLTDSKESSNKSNVNIDNSSNSEVNEISIGQASSVESSFTGNNLQTSDASSSNKEHTKCEAEAMDIDSKDVTLDKVEDVPIKIEEAAINNEGEETDQNSSAESVINWSMVTPEKKTRKRRVSEVSADKYSPKQLRSKRLSLSKQTPENNSEKVSKKAKTTSKNNKVSKPDRNDTSSGKKSPEDKKSPKKTPETNNPENLDIVTEEVVSKSATPDSESTSHRKANKRKNESSVTPPSQTKKAKIEPNLDEGGQDSLALLKNSTVKPRKKKIIKSNTKSSPNNLEQWLIKSGKSVVKTSLLSSSDQSSSQSESNIINTDSEVQISSSEPKKIIVEISPACSKSTNNSNSTVSDEKVTETEEPFPNEEIIHHEIKDSPQRVIVERIAENESILIASSDDDDDDDEIIPSVLEPEVPKVSVVNQAEDIESIERQFLEAIKRGVEEEEKDKKRMQEEERLRHSASKREEEEDEDEELLTESLKCDETELERSTSELERNSNASRVKLESMIYAKYKTTLRRPRRRKRLLRRVKKQDGENDLEEELGEEEEEETFEERRERLVTPFRPTSGRSAQMVMMATTEEEPPVTPVRSRKSITPIQLTENWPEGRCELWVPYLPTPPGVSPSLGILKRNVSPVVSPTSSPKTSKKKRVSFLDPPVSKGLLYSKGSDNIGQVQHANIPPGKKPVWKDGAAGGPEERSSPSKSKTQDISARGSGVVEADDELNAIQEFLNSTPDAPWKDSPIAGEISKIPGILTCSDPVRNIVSKIATPGDERKLAEELQGLKICTIGGFCSLKVSDIKKLSIRPAKVNTLYNVLKDYFQCQPSSSKKSPGKSLEESSKPLEESEKMEIVEGEIEITTLGIEMGVQVDPAEICSDDTFTMPQMSQMPQDSAEECLTPPVVKEPDMYSDSQEEIKIPSRDEIALMFQSEVFIKRAAPFATLDFFSKLAAAAADYFRQRPD